MKNIKSHDLIEIKSNNKSKLINVNDIVVYREILFFLIWRDLKIRYRQMFFGVLWVVLQPLLMVGLYSIIFGSIIKLPHVNYPYALFILTGLIPWTFLSNSISDSGNSLLSNAQLLNKVYFPRIYLPLSRIFVILFDFVIASILLFFTTLCLNVKFFTPLFIIPFIFLLCTFISLGAGAFFSALNVKYRDFHYIVPFVLQILMFSTPIIYPVDAIPARFRWIIDLNPLTGIVEAYRVAFLGGELRLSLLAYSAVVSVGVLIVGVLYFNHVEHRFADII